MKTIRELEIPEYQMPYVLSVFRKMSITDFHIQQEGKKAIVKANVSNRMEKKIKRNLWAAEKSEQTGIRYLTREDINSSLSGIIPKSESYYFQQAMM